MKSFRSNDMWEVCWGAYGKYFPLQIKKKKGCCDNTILPLALALKVLAYNWSYCCSENDGGIRKNLSLWRHCQTAVPI